MDSLDIIDKWGPEKIVVVSDSRTGMRGALVIDNTARGMGKGGTRMALDVNVHETARLARVMTWKWAANGLFFGGAKAGIQFDPKSPDKEAAIRAFARKLKNEVPSEYVLGLDMGLSADDAAVFQDEVGFRGSAVGLPAVLGDVPHGDLGVTGYGVAHAVFAQLARMQISPEDARVSIQGLGSVGAASARYLSERGVKIVGVSSAVGVLIDNSGIDVDHLLDLRRVHGDDCVHEYGARNSGALGDELRMKCDILIPAAKEDVIGKKEVKELRAKAIVEAANLPIEDRALDELWQQGIDVVPDFIANSGGIIAAAHLTDYSLSPFSADQEAIFSDTKNKILDNVGIVMEASRRRGVTPHEAARALAQQRVESAMRSLGRI